MSDSVADEGVIPVKVGDTFKHPYRRTGSWRPKCHVRAIVDDDVIVVRWFGRQKQWWHYECMHISDLDLQALGLGQ